MSERGVGKTFSHVQDVVYDLRGVYFLEMFLRIVRLEKIKLEGRFFCLP